MSLHFEVCYSKPVNPNLLFIDRCIPPGYNARMEKKERHPDPFPGFGRVQRPTRYIGGEVGSIMKDPAKVNCRIALAFPDVYEIGMSHLGYSIVYHGFNSDRRVYAERVFAPWFDAEEEIRKANQKLSTLETGTPLSDFDIIGFTLSHELAATNVLNMLDLGGVPVLAGDRRDGDPIVIAGGCSAANPEPLSDFIDAFYLGDAEPVFSELADVLTEAREKKWPRNKIVEAIAYIGGMYVPSFFDPQYENGKFTGMLTRTQSFPTPTRRVAADLDNYPLPDKPVIPLAEAVHNRIAVEVARGCTRGCRFCEAGMYYRPVRERSPKNVIGYACAALDNTGHEELSLMALTTGDYTRLGETLRALVDECEERRVEISLPSMRFGTLEKSLASELARFRKTGFTLAPEAATDRLRRVINKVIDEEQMIAEVTALAGMGWKQFKLYFIIGLPTETEKDIKGIVELSKKIKSAAGKGAKVTASASTFVPKPFTPFQWEAMLPLDEIHRRQSFLRTELGGSGIKWKYHDARTSVVEGVLARGGRECGRLLLELHKRGAKFCAWTDYFNKEAWNESFAAAGIDLDKALGTKEVADPLPWDHIDMRIDRKFLESEREKAHRAEPTPDCRVGGCVDCGACDSSGTETRLAADAPALPERKSGQDISPQPETFSRYRITFRKFGKAIFLGHLELKSVFEKALRRTKLPLRFTRGFHPQMRLVFSPPLPVGIASEAELADVFLNEEVEPNKILDRLRAEVPEGLEITRVTEIQPQQSSLQQAITATTYSVDISQLEIPPAQLEKSIYNFEKLDEMPVMRKQDDRAPMDLKIFVQDISVASGQIKFSTDVVDGFMVRAALVLEHIFEFTDETFEKVLITKTGIEMENS